MQSINNEQEELFYLNGTSSLNTIENDLFESLDSQHLNMPLIIIPLVSIFSMSTNLLNIIVFLHPKMKDTSFKYMLAISCSNFLYVSLGLYGYALYCEQCPINKAYVTQLFKIIIEYFIASCFGLFSILIEIIISVHRYCVLENKNNLINKQLAFKYVVPILFSITIVIYVPVLFTYEIVSINNDNYSKQKTEFGQTLVGRSMPILQSIIRIFLSSIVLLVLNIGNLIQFRKRFQTKYNFRVKYSLTASIYNIFFFLFYS